MDDSEDRVRIHVTAPLLTLVNLAIGPLAKQQQPKHQQLLTDLTKSLLIHLDDHNSAVQVRMCNARTYLMTRTELHINACQVASCSPLLY